MLAGDFPYKIWTFIILSLTVCLCQSFLTFPLPCRNSSAERSTLPSNQLQDDLTTLSISIQSSQRKHPEVQTATPPPPLPPPPPLHTLMSGTTFRIKCDFVQDQQLFLCLFLRLSGGSSQCQRPSAVQRIQFCGHNRRGNTTATQYYCSGTYTLIHTII